MLRYKNSLLERVLLEKGIDVQAELALKGSPNLRPHRVPPVTGQASPMQKAMLSRQQQARHRPAMAPPIQTVNSSSQSGGQRSFADSPTVQPTPPSQNSSPSTARSPGFALQGGMTSPATDIATQQPQQQQQGRPLPPLQHHVFAPQRRVPAARTFPNQATAQAFPPRAQANPTMQDNYYPASFQKHYSQLGKLTRPLCMWSSVRPRLIACYRTGVRCTTRHHGRFRRRRRRHGQLHSELPSSPDHCRFWHANGNASITTHDHECCQRWKWQSHDRSL
ncbi:hypothetical protein EDD37DRAFT_631688 [Exophiala viscosa]|uniref:uncharacterized protein n=1 Tax=Exophiala viscosa TaxID=2486360 RepID=UPI00218FA4DA|nr:hypothetical protein EDD37DRAFT_631688 [Exophiala viscosa]